MLEFFTVLAGSWPIAAMVIGVTIALVVNARFKQGISQDDEIRNLRASQAVVVKQRTDY